MEVVISSRNRDPLSTDTWKERMTTFMNLHLAQLLDYDVDARLVVYDRVGRFSRGAGLPHRTLDDPCHKMAVIEVINMLRHPTEVAVKTHITHLVSKYGDEGRREDFEEIAFVFAIIVNAPLIKKNETCWEN